MSEPIHLSELEQLAKAKLPQMVYDYFAGGACDEQTMRANQTAFQDYWVRSRVLVQVGERTLQQTCFGKTYATPFSVAPMAFQKLAHVDGELASVRAAGNAGYVFVASTMSTFTLEEIAAAATGPVWFQLYVFQDRGITRSLVQRAEAAGYQALQVTADVPVMGRRERDMRHAFHLPTEYRVANFSDQDYSEMPALHGESGPAIYTRCRFDANLTWKDVEWLASLTKLPVLVKGVLRGDDAVCAIEHGAAGVVVSNHGGRQLDTAPPTVRVLPEIVDALAGRGTVLLDGGVRRGTDALKALALGAKFVQLGRPIMWGLAWDGQNGVERVLTMFQDEFDNALALSGCSSLQQITRDLVMTR